MNNPKNNSAELNANSINVFIGTGSITSTISPANALSSPNIVNSGTITFDNANLRSKDFNGKLTVAPNTDLVLQTLENIKELILGAYSNVIVSDLNDKLFENPTNQEKTIVLSGEFYTSDSLNNPHE